MTARPPTRLVVVAGEASGDLHGGEVLAELRRLLPELETVGIGGERMRATGQRQLYTAAQMGFMGFVEVVRHLPLIRRVERDLSAELDSRPAAVLLIDYPGLNLRLADAAHRRGIPVIWYISPQVWAWKAGRLPKLARLVSRMLVVFPFEVPLYESVGAAVEFVGHPLLDELPPPSERTAALTSLGLDPTKRWVALLPGSRAQEIGRLLPPMLGAGKILSERNGVGLALAEAPGADPALYDRLLAATPAPVVRIAGSAPRLVEHAEVALVASGTATLETALMGTPMVIVYKTSPATFAIGKRLVKIAHIGLPNIVAGRRVVPELLQTEVTAERLADEAGRLLTDPDAARQMRTDLRTVRDQLGTPGAARRVARTVAEFLPS